MTVEAKRWDYSTLYASISGPTKLMYQYTVGLCCMAS